MEADRSSGCRGRRNRKPLADCTNTFSRSSQSSSSSAALVKPSNPCLASSLKRIVDDVRLKERSGFGDQSNFGTGNASQSQVADVTNPNFGAPLSPATAPSRPRNSRSISGVGDKEIVEPYSVFTRRKTSAKRKHKEKSVSQPVNCFLTDSISGSGERTREADINLSKSLRAPREKRQRRAKVDQDHSVHTLPQEFIEQQKAYFAEIDAFELPEEEVTSANDLE